MSMRRVFARVPAGRAVDVVVIGAGHSGLAMSRRLGEAGIDHVVLERGEVANSWRHERWDSLRLLTPNWQCRLPGLRYDGDDPDGFMPCAELVDFIERYAAHIDAPVRTGTRVESVELSGERYRVVTDHGVWSCRGIVIASGPFNLPVVPAAARSLPPSVHSVSAMWYRSPAQLPESGVLVVGASATGLQLASEIRRSGRAVTLAVGEHIRMPRRYRGRDIQWWMDRAGVLDQFYRDVEDIDRARRVPSPQLVGTPGGETLDLNALQRQGVRVAGRLVGVSEDRAQFSGSLHNHCAMADLKLRRLLGTFDEWAAGTGIDAEVEPPSRPEPTHVTAAPALSLDFGRERIGSVVWATGFRADHSWLHVPVFDRKGRLCHDGGVVVGAPAMCILGLPFLRRRKSSYIHGAEDDTRDLCAYLVDTLRGGSGEERWRAVG
jgi:putative flavoprotein involved in K+ transport